MAGMVGIWLLLVEKMWPQFKMFQLISTLRTVVAEMLLNILAEFEEQTDTKQRQWQEESVHLLNLILILLELSWDYCWRNWVTVLYFKLCALDIVNLFLLAVHFVAWCLHVTLAFRKKKLNMVLCLYIHNSLLSEAHNGWNLNVNGPRWIKANTKSLLL